MNDLKLFTIEDIARIYQVPIELIEGGETMGMLLNQMEKETEDRLRHDINHYAREQRTYTHIEAQEHVMEKECKSCWKCKHCGGGRGE